MTGGKSGLGGNIAMAARIARPSHFAAVRFTDAADIAAQAAERHPRGYPPEAVSREAGWGMTMSRVMTRKFAGQAPAPLTGYCAQLARLISLLGP